MSKASRACDISQAVRREVMRRDEGRCIICGSMYGIQIAHFISRARMGLGIPQNLGCMCLVCHGEMDNGKCHRLYQSAFESHLRAKYPDWDKEKLIYHKYKGE